MAKRILIFGGVAGGASTAARLRRLDETAEINMFERGDYISFANCGLPYYIGAEIKNRDDLLLRSPENFKQRFNIEVRIRNEVTGIDPEKKQINVKNLNIGKTYIEPYDKLILSPGIEPVRPAIDGIDSSRVFTLRNIGVRAEVKLAEEAGLEIGLCAGIKVDEHLQTSEPDICAIGDAIEVRDFVLGNATLIPLAGPANKQGRMAADNISGKKYTYTGTRGTAIPKVFDLTAAMTGASEKALSKMDIEHEKLYLHQANHAGYYPGAKPMHIKLLFSKLEGKVLGAQIVGADGVDKRIDVFAIAIRAGMTVFDLQELELAYAPPYGSGKDPVNIAGFAAADILDGTVKIKHFTELQKDDLILDVRKLTEFARGSVPDAKNIPLNDLRGRLEELPMDRTIHVYCSVGHRSYIARMILEQNGFDARNLPGGYMTNRTVANSGQLK